MLSKPTLRETWLPLGLAGLVLIVLNWGLYTRLAAKPAAPTTFALPFAATFDDGKLPADFSSLGGTWEVRDQTLVQMNTTGFDLGILLPVTIPADQSYLVSTRMRFLGGKFGGGIMFNAQSPTRQKSHLARVNVDGGKLWLVYGYFGDDSNFVGQGSTPLGISPEDANWHDFAIQVSEADPAHYVVLIDGKTITDSIKTVYSGGKIGVVSSTSQVAFDDIRIEKLEPQTIAVATTATPAISDAAPSPTEPNQGNLSLIWQETFAANQGDSQWKAIRGTWVAETGAFVQTQQDGYDFAAIYQKATSAPYQLTVKLAHRAKVGGGLLFNLSTADSTAGATMVRYIDDVIAWGYFDATGNFVGQGSAPVPAPGTALHALTVVNQGATYTLSLDGQILATDVSINNPGGNYIALTSSQSVVAFTGVSLFGISNAPANTPVATAAPIVATQDATQSAAAALTVRAINGSWQDKGQTITQTEREPVDYLAGVGVLAERFTLSADILLPDDLPDAGGGLLIQMQGADDLSQASMVRFANGGKELFWGSFDATRTFKGQGSVPLNLTGKQAHRLTLLVRSNSFDIVVDETTVATNIPLTPRQGWIGLISFRGAVTFSNLQLQVGEPAPVQKATP